MTLTANSSGIVTGKFTIPANVPYGIKNVGFLGAGGSYGQASFFGQGTEVDDVRTMVTQITTTLWQQNVDPIAQTFTLTEPVQVDSIDLWFTAVGSTTVSVQIRETQVGFPTKTVLTEGRLNASSITAGQWTRFAFNSPTRLEAGVEYAIVALCNDAVSELAVAELGKYDSDHQKWITSQPYTVGVLLSSSNASTWSAHQDRDLAFKLNVRQYTETERMINLGDVTLAGATDLLLFSTIDAPSSAATGELEVTLPNGTVIKSGDNQHIALLEATSGALNVKARLRADVNSSAALFSGTEVIQGIVQATGTYISNAMDGDAAGCDVKVVYDAIIPSGATVVAEVCGGDIGDTWQSTTAIGVPKLLNNEIGLYEYQFHHAALMEAKVKVRLTLNGTILARPRVRNLRVIVT